MFFSDIYIDHLKKSNQSVQLFSRDWRSNTHIRHTYRHYSIFIYQYSMVMTITKFRTARVNLVTLSKVFTPIDVYKQVACIHRCLHHTVYWPPILPHSSPAPRPQLSISNIQRFTSFHSGEFVLWFRSCGTDKRAFCGEETTRIAIKPF